MAYKKTKFGTMRSWEQAEVAANAGRPLLTFLTQYPLLEVSEVCAYIQHNC